MAVEKGSGPQPTGAPVRPGLYPVPHTLPSHGDLAHIESDERGRSDVLPTSPYNSKTLGGIESDEGERTAERAKGYQPRTSADIAKAPARRATRKGFRHMLAVGALRLAGLTTAVTGVAATVGHDMAVNKGVLPGPTWVMPDTQHDSPALNGAKAALGNEGQKNSEVTFENPHFWSDVQKAENMTPTQLKALQVKVQLPNGKPTTSEDILAGDDEDILHRYQGMLVSATIIDDNGRPTDKGVIAVAFENNDNSVAIGYFVLNLSQRARIGSSLESQTYDPFTLNSASRGASTTLGFATPARQLIEAISRFSFDPSKPQLPRYDQDGPFSFTLKPGEIVQITSTDAELQHFMDAVSGPSTGKNPNLQETYDQQKAGLSSGEVMPPFSFSGNTEQGVLDMLAKAPTSNKSFRIISMLDSVKTPPNIYPEGPNPTPSPATINGQKTTIAVDFGLRQKANQPWS